MREVRLISVLLFILLSVPALASNCSSLFARDLISQNDYFSFNVYKVDGSLWGSWVLNAGDQSISYYDSAFVKFRVDLDSFKSIAFEHLGGQTGELVTHWYDDYRFCIATIQRSHWEEMVSFVELWPEGGLFKNYNKIRQTYIE